MNTAPHRSAQRPLSRRAWLWSAIFFAAWLAAPAPAATWVPGHTAQRWVESPIWLYGWIDGHWTERTWVPEHTESRWTDGYWDNQWTDGYWSNQWTDGYWDNHWVDGYTNNNWVDGYWDNQWTDGYWDNQWNDGHWEDQWTDGYWDGDGNWVDGSWSSNWVDGYWSSNWVEGGWSSNWVEGYRDTTTVDGHWENNWVEGHWDSTWVEGHWDSIWIDGYTEVVTIAGYWIEPVWMPGYFGWTLHGGYWENYWVEGQWVGPWVWTAFDENVGAAGGFSAWTPDASTVPANQVFTQTRTGTQNFRTGERNEAGEERNVATGSRSVTETNPNAIGTMPNAPTVPAITSDPTATAVIGEIFSWSISANNSPTAYGASGLPTGLALNATTGLISGTPTQSGTFAVALTATNAAGTSSAFTLTLQVGGHGTPMITSEPTAAGLAGVAFGYIITATNTPTSFGSSGLPEGLSVDVSSGSISGTPALYSAGTYYATISATNANGSRSMTLTIRIDAVQFTLHPQSQTVTGGANVTLSASAVGVAPLTYQWKKNGVALSGSTATSLSLPGVSTGSSGIYTVTVSNAAGSTTSGLATLNVTPMPVASAIRIQPSNQLAIDSGFTFSVTATGTAPLTYQWKRNGVAIAGATGATFQKSPALSADAGAYTVTVSNSVGSATSASATLTLGTYSHAPQITSQPASQTADLGQSVGFEIVVSEMPFYQGGWQIVQWRKNGAAIPGQSGQSLLRLNLSNVTAADAGTYDATVTNNDGTTVSVGATLTILGVTAPPVALHLTQQPTISGHGPLVAATRGVGTTVTISAAANATVQPIGFQWGKYEEHISSANVTTLTLPDGSILTTLTLPNVQLSDSGSYQIAAFNSSALVISQAVQLTVASGPTVSAAPVITSATSATATEGVAFNYQITATNSPTSYSATGLPAGLAISSTTGAISGTPSASGSFTVSLTATNAVGASPSVALTLTISTAVPPTILSATSVNSTVNEIFVYEIEATNSPTSFGASGLPSGLSISTSSGIVTGNLAQTGTFPVQIYASNAGGTASATLTITVTDVPVAGPSGPPTITADSFFAEKNKPIPATSLKIVASDSPTSFGATGLPAGIALDGATGVFSGTPTQSGVFSMTISATNAIGTASANLSFFVADEWLDMRAGETKHITKVWSGVNVPAANSWRRWHLQPEPRYSAIGHEPPTVDPVPGQPPLLEPHPFDTWSRLVVTPMASGRHGVEIWLSTDQSGTPALTASHFLAINVRDFSRSTGTSTFGLPGELTTAQINSELQNWALKNYGDNLHTTVYPWSGSVDFDLKAKEAWKNGNAGSPTITVLVLDSGVEQNHPGLKISDVNDSKNFGIDSATNPRGWADRTRGYAEIHGTQVAGCVAGLFTNPPLRGYAYGVAPGVRIASARVGSNYQDNGTFTLSAVALAEAMDWGVYERGARITVSSFKASYYTEGMEANFEDHRGGTFTEAAFTGPYAGTSQKGVIHFVAAGNNDLPYLEWPAMLSYVNAVGAVTGKGNWDTGENVRWHIPAAGVFGTDSYRDVQGSNRGVGLDFVAPGHQIATLYPTWLPLIPGSTDLSSQGIIYYQRVIGWDFANRDGGGQNERYANSGTSLAAPFAAGVAALILSQNPSWTAAAVETRMQMTAQRIPKNRANNPTFGGSPDSDYNTTFGWGMVDASAATKAGDWNTLNLSTLGRINAAGQEVVMGFAIAGTVPKRVLVRAIGPTLASYVAGVLATPTMTVRKLPTNEVLGTNTGWSTAPNNSPAAKLTEIRAVSASYSALPIPNDSADCALLLTLQPGNYTATITGANSAVGQVLAEVYDTSGSAVKAQFVNLSTSSSVETGNTMIGGFVTKGDGPRSVLIRAVGPSLADVGVNDFLSDPRLLVKKQSDSTGGAWVVVAENDNWQTQPNWASIRGFSAAVGAFALRSNSKDAAVLLELEPNASYTVEVTGIGSTPGVAMVEVYPAQN